MSLRARSAVWQHALASGTDLVILLHLAERADDAGVCWPGVADIATHARITERGAQKALRRLEAVGELVIEIQPGRRHTNLYRLTPGGNPVPQDTFSAPRKANFRATKGELGDRKGEPGGTQNEMKRNELTRETARSPRGRLKRPEPTRAEWDRLAAE